jgi:hypothetical protein
MAWVTSNLAPLLGIQPEEILVVGTEFGIFGDIGSIPGSDSRMVIPSPTFLSVGPGPLPAPVLHLGGGPARFRELLSDQTHFVEGGLPALFIPTMDAAWHLRESGFHPGFEQEIESLFAIANGFSGCRGAFCCAFGGTAPPMARSRASMRRGVYPWPIAMPCCKFSPSSPRTTKGPSG